MTKSQVWVFLIHIFIMVFYLLYQSSPEVMCGCNSTFSYSFMWCFSTAITLPVQIAMW